MITKVDKMKSKINQKLFKPKSLLIFSAVIFLVLSFIQIPVISVKAQTDPIPTPVSEAHDMINNNTLYPDLLILDVRNQWEYDEGHICNATLIPVDVLESRISEIVSYKDTEILVYCRSGGRSATASQILVDNNFTKVYNMLEGFTAWTSSGYESCPDTSGSNGSSDPTIPFSLNYFLVVFIGVIGFILFSYRRHRIT